MNDRIGMLQVAADVAKFYSEIPRGAAGQRRDLDEKEDAVLNAALDFLAVHLKAGTGSANG